MAYGGDVEGQFVIFNRTKDETELFDCRNDLLAYLGNHPDDYLSKLYMHSHLGDCIADVSYLLPHLRRKVNMGH